MNDEFWERLDKLEESAKSVTIKDWEYSDAFGQLSIMADNGCYRAQIAKAVFAGSAEDMKYIAAASPAMILEMCAELRKLKKEANWLSCQLEKKEHGCEWCEEKI